MFCSRTPALLVVVEELADVGAQEVDLSLVLKGVRLQC